MAAAQRLGEAGLNRDFLKRRLEHALASPLVTRFTRRRLRGRRLVLAYHGIVPAAHGTLACGERALFVPEERFIAQLDAIAAVADVAALDRLDEPGDGRPRVAITFDDAYRGAVTAGLAALSARGLPATVFVAPGCLDGHVFWWDALAGSDGVLDAALRTYALTVLGGEDARVRAWALHAGHEVREDLPPFARAASLGDLEAAVEQPGVTIGSHSWSHAALPSLDRDALLAELERPLAWLRERFGERASAWLAYPYGLENAAVRAAAEAAGYTGALAITGGWHDPVRAPRFARPRLTVGAGMSVDGLVARVLGARSV